MKEKCVNAINKAKSFFKTKFSKNKEAALNEEGAILEDGIEIIDVEEKKQNRFTAWFKKLKKWQKALFIAGTTVVTIVAILAIALVGLRISGKSSIYSETKNQKPNLNIAEKETVENVGEIEIDSVEDTDEGEDVIIQIGNEEESEAGTTNSQNQSQNKDQTTTTKKPGFNDAVNNNTLEFADKDEDEYDLIFNGQKYKYNEDMITLLLLGIDKLEVVKPAENGIKGGQSDAIFLLIMNPHTMVMDLIAIPRDTIALVDIYNKDGSYSMTGYTQICLQHGYGDAMELSNERSKKAVSRLMYDLPINSVTSFNMGAIADLNDAVGGVTLQCLHTFKMDGVSFTAGQTITLKGMDAYRYTRFRDTSRHYTATERLERQKQYLSKYVDQAMSAVASNVGVVVDIYDVISDYVVTDLSIDEMTYLASEAVSYSFGGIYSLEGTVDTSRKYERYYLDEGKLQELIVSKFYEKVN